MADLVITTTSVIASAGASTDNGTAGATITAGQAVYRDATDSRYKLADSNGAAELRSPGGIALNGAATGQALRVLTSGSMTINAVMTAGVAYYLSDTPGGICPVADVGAGEFATVIGLATSTTVLSVRIQESGVAL